MSQATSSDPVHHFSEEWTSGSQTGSHHPEGPFGVFCSLENVYQIVSQKPDLSSPAMSGETVTARSDTSSSDGACYAVGAISSTMVEVTWTTWSPTLGSPAHSQHEWATPGLSTAR